MTTYLGEKAVGVGTIRAEIGVSGVVLRDSTLKGNGNTEPLGVDTEVIATKEDLQNIGAEGCVKKSGDNDTDYTLKFRDFEALSADGTIPLERLTKVTDQIGDISTTLTAILGE